MGYVIWMYPAVYLPEQAQETGSEAAVGANHLDEPPGLVDAQILGHSTSCESTEVGRIGGDDLAAAVLKYEMNCVLYLLTAEADIRVDMADPNETQMNENEHIVLVPLFTNVTYQRKKNIQNILENNIVHLLVCYSVC